MDFSWICEPNPQTWPPLVEDDCFDTKAASGLGSFPRK
jgi:hypothetical protein